MLPGHATRDRTRIRRSSGVKCRNCGDEVDPRRVELGYDYCTRPECQERLAKRVELARVTVNKAADQYVRAEEVVPSGPRPKWGIDKEDDEARTPERRVEEGRPGQGAERERAHEDDALVEACDLDDPLEARRVPGEREERRREQEQRDQREVDVVEVHEGPHERRRGHAGAGEREADEHRRREAEDPPW